MKLNLNVNEFTENLADKTPAPGGGGAAALVGALAASLASMVAKFTVGKMYEKNLDLNKIINRTKELRNRLLEIIKEDEEAFKKINSAENKNQAFLDAAKPPLDIMITLKEVIGFLEKLVDNCSKYIVSDVGISFLFAKAAIRASYLNVHINISLVKICETQENSEADEISKKAEEILVLANNSRIYERTLERLDVKD